MEDLALTLAALPDTSRWSPAFDFCHFLLCSLAVRKDAGRELGFRNPVAAWLGCLVASFAGGVLVNPLLGKPILAAFKDEYLVLLASAAFALMFYCPGDVVYRLMTAPPDGFFRSAAPMTIYSLKEVQRTLKVAKGLHEGMGATSGTNVLVPLAVAVLRGNGSSFAKPLTRALVGANKSAEDWELLIPSTTTLRVCFVALCFLALGLPPSIQPGQTWGCSLNYVLCVAFLVGSKVSEAALGIPVNPLDRVGGFVEGVLRTVSGQSAPVAQGGRQKKTE